MSTFHPAHILRGGDGEQDQPGGESSSAVDLLFYFFLYDIAKAYRLANGQAPLWADELDLFVFRNELLRTDGETFYGCAPAALAQALDRVYEEAREIGEFSVDVETDSKDAMRAHLTAIAFATLQGGVAATWDAYQRAPQALATAKAICACPHIHCVIHNRIYDGIVMPRHGLPILGPVEDTLLQHHAAFPGLPHKLQQVATQFFVVPPWKAEFRRGEKDEASLVLYNGRDALLTARLRPPLTKMIEAHKTTRVYEADRQQFTVATHMRRVGYFVDRKEQARQAAVQHARLDYMHAALGKEFAAIEEPWRQALSRQLAQKQRKKDPESYMDRVAKRYAEIANRKRKPTDIGFFKPKAKADLVALFEVLRIPITDYTPKGAPVTDKKAMENAAGRHPLMRRLIHLREAIQLLATFIEGLPVLDDGRVHPDWSPKISGRWGAGKAQNWPKYVSGWPPQAHPDGRWKTKPSGDLICPSENPRAIVTAPTVEEILALPAFVVDPRVRMRAKQGHGRILVGADFSQVELRIAGFLARDEFILDIYRQRKDAHAMFARECFGAKFTDAEGEFYRIADAAGLKVKIKADLSKIDGLDAETRAQLLRPWSQWNRMRDLTKRGEYCGIYGGTAETVYESVVKDFPEVQLSGLRAIVDTVNKKMEGVVRWRREQETYARVNREIREQILGRVRLFPLGNFNPNIVYNFPIQALAASLLALGIFRFTVLTQPQLLQVEALYRMKLLDGAWVHMMRGKGYDTWRAPVDLLLNGHDSLTAEADEEDGDKAAECLEASMSQELPMGDETMSFPAEAGKGRRWSET